MHQIVSNLRAIAEPFVFLTTWLKYFSASLKSSQILVFQEFSKEEKGGGGGVTPLYYQIFLPFRISCIRLPAACPRKRQRNRWVCDLSAPVPDAQALRRRHGVILPLRVIFSQHFPMHIQYSFILGWAYTPRFYLRAGTRTDSPTSVNMETGI